MKKKKYTIAYLMHGARNVGGGENSIYLLIKNLSRDVFEPVVLYANENEIVRKIQREGIETIKIPLHEKITSVYRDSIRYDPFALFTYLWHLISGILTIRRILKMRNVALLHPHDNLSKIIGGIAAKTLRVQVVAHCRDDLRGDFIGCMIRCVYRFLVDRVIAVSERTKMSLAAGINMLQGKTTVIYNGVDLDIFTPDRCMPDLIRELRINDRTMTIAVIAVLEEYKGHIYLFKAVKRLLQGGIDNVCCLVVGDGREREQLMSFVKREDIGEAVHFLGYRRDIPELLRITNILAIPSIAQEAFPRVALEAMAMKVPVVCTDFGGLPEAVVDGETGIVVPSGNADALYDAIKALVTNYDARRFMGESGRKRVENMFSIKTNVGRTEHLYLDVLGCSEGIQHIAAGAT